METDKDIGSYAALAVTTAGLQGARQPELPMDLAGLGETAIVRWGEANRRRPTLTDHLPSEAPTISFKAAGDKVMQQQSWEVFSPAFQLAAKSTQGVMRQVVQHWKNTILAADNFLRVQDEELQMLWWLTGQRSSDYDCPFDEIPTDALPLVLANELAGMTKFLPGPPSVKGILSRAGLKERKKVTISVAVNAADPDWLQRLIGDREPSVVSTPLHAAVKRQMETGAGDAWVAGWAAATGVNLDHALSGLALGNLFYRERLLLMCG